jgi:uncharacterized caspase-like protein
MKTLFKFLTAFLPLVYCFQAEASHNIYAVVVGVSDYQDDDLQIDLEYCDDDALLFYNQLIKSNVPSSNIRFLSDHKATRSAIITSVNYIFSKAQPSDQVIFYFSGHGGKGYFIPSDYTGYSNVLYHSEVKDLFKKCKANKKIFIADACFSGGIKSHTPKEIVKSSSAVSDARIVVMMSSRDYQTSLEMRKFSHGVFTYFLVKALTGLADKNNDKIITVSEMYYYTKENVILETDKKQVPIIFGKFDREMPILYLR